METDEKKRGRDRMAASAPLIFGDCWWISLTALSTRFGWRGGGEHRLLNFRESHEDNAQSVTTEKTRIDKYA